MSSPAHRDFRGFRPERFGRSGGGASLPVPLLLKADHWWDASVGYTLVSGKVSNWVDRINLADASQPVAGNRFVFSASGNQLPGPVMVADRLNPDMVSCTPGAGFVGAATGPYTMAAAVYWGNVSAANLCSIDDVTGTGAYVSSVIYPSATQGNLHQETNDAAVLGNVLTGPSGGIAAKWQVVWNDGANKYVVASTGPQTAFAQVARPVTATTFHIGAAGAVHSGLTGEIRDVLYWNRGLAPAEITLLTSWLAMRCGL